MVQKLCVLFSFLAILLSSAKADEFKIGNDKHEVKLSCAFTNCLIVEMKDGKRETLFDGINRDQGKNLIDLSLKSNSSKIYFPISSKKMNSSSGLAPLRFVLDLTHIAFVQVPNILSQKIARLFLKLDEDGSLSWLYSSFLKSFKTDSIATTLKKIKNRSV
ncbi:hypothetical protein HBN50_02220 [Halobacteriovorax sp. GB3]|uniref:hypothetical protein n=1 Tax=Halobacteriovorax sp. GB3 TaxID=2719615 RepID=UPI002362636B|nr:hypothetical protein [Halobacteriovorax sp. GB3]MDD0851888.1 hypothetical protein [Halobacteriovorax sp. GB3]